MLKLDGHYARLKGARVLEVAFADDGTQSPVPVLLMRLADRTVVEVAVLCDPEGNGAGFLDIQAYVPEEEVA